jgi:hypothetical protein
VNLIGPIFTRVMQSDTEAGTTAVHVRMVQTNRETIMRLIITIVAVISTGVNVMAQTANIDMGPV